MALGAFERLGESLVQGGTYQLPPTYSCSGSALRVCSRYFSVLATWACKRYQPLLSKHVKNIPQHDRGRFLLLSSISCYSLTIPYELRSNIYRRCCLQRMLSPLVDVKHHIHSKESSPRTDLTSHERCVRLAQQSKRACCMLYLVLVLGQFTRSIHTVPGTESDIDISPGTCPSPLLFPLCSPQL